MSAAAGTAVAADPNRVGHDNHPDGQPPFDETGGGEGGPASRRVIIGYGFWIFLLSDILIFSALFATYAVLSDATAGGPTGAELFDLPSVAIQTTCLLASTLTCGLAGIAASARHMVWTQASLALTGLLGAVFLALEMREFAGLLAEGAGPTRSAFLSAFFALVGAHGVHVTIGLLWLVVMMAQLFSKGLRENVLNRLLCFTLFWHALDIVWIGVLTNVYLMGANG